MTSKVKRLRKEKMAARAASRASIAKEVIERLTDKEPIESSGVIGSSGAYVSVSGTVVSVSGAPLYVPYSRTQVIGKAIWKGLKTP